MHQSFAFALSVLGVTKSATLFNASNIQHHSETRSIGMRSKLTIQQATLEEIDRYHWAQADAGVSVQVQS